MILIKVIIVGTYGLLTETLVTRLKKEACENFVITGSKIPEETRHKNVVEEYPFDYSNINIPFIMESIKAEVVIYTGALDERLSLNKQSDAIAYIGGLYNMLISASKSGVKKFIYLSSTQVYDKTLEGLIEENSRTTSEYDLETMTIMNGEEIVLKYGLENDMQVVILRCSEAYDFYNNKLNMASFCTELSIELMKNNVVYIDKNKQHDFIHVADVAEAIYRTIVVKELNQKIYNICSGCSFTEEQTYRLASELLTEKGEVRYLGDSPVIDKVFSYGAAKRDLGFTVKYSFEEGFIRLIERLKQFSLKNDPKVGASFSFAELRGNIRSILKWLFPYFETIAVFSAVQLITYITRDSVYFKSIDLYLLYVVFIAVIYGKGQTTIALLLSFAGKIALEPDFSIYNAVVDYNNYVWMLQFLIVGMGTGYIRDKYKQSIGDKEETIEYLNAELAEIKEINHSNIRIKKIYESRLINYQDSFGRIYTILSKLGDLEPDKVMYEAVDVIAQIMNSNDIVIYGVSKGSNYARVIASSSNMKTPVKKSVELGTLDDVYEEIKKRKIYVNRTLGNDKPAMAGGIFQDDNLMCIIFIWYLPFENTGLYYLNLFQVVLSLIEQALQRAHYFIDENRGSRYIDDTKILTERAFETIRDIRRQGSETNVTEFCVLEIIREGGSLKEINDMIVPILRQQDYLGLGKNGKLYLLLSNTNESEAENVISRLLKNGIEARKETVK